MDMKHSRLFSPLQIGSLTLSNRVGMAPMSMDYEAADGTVPKRLADVFVRRAEGGTGYVLSLIHISRTRFSVWAKL